MFLFIIHRIGFSLILYYAMLLLPLSLNEIVELEKEQQEKTSLIEQNF